jgi:PAS domain S-box-containing protein
MSNQEQAGNLVLETIQDILSFSETPNEAISKILEKLHEISEAKVVALFRCPEGSVNTKHTEHELIDILPKRKKHLLDKGLFERLTALLHSEKEIVVISNEFHKELFDELSKPAQGLSILLPMKTGNTTIGGFLILGLPNEHKLEFIIRDLETLGNIFALVFRFSELYMNMEEQVAERTAAFKASEEKFRKFFEEDLTGDFLINADGILLDCNKAFLSIFGYDSKNELLNQHIHILYDDKSEFEYIKKKLKENGFLKNYETKRKCRNGTLIHVTENEVATFDPTGKITEIQGYLYDITDRKEAESQLKAEKEWSEKLINHAPNIVVGLQENSKIAVFNRFAEQLTGYKAEEVIGKEWIGMFIPEELQEDIYRIWEQIIDNQLIDHYFENEIITRSGKRRLIGWGNTIITENGEFRMILSLGSDITERRMAEKALTEQKNLLTAIYRNAPLVMMVVDGERHVRQINGFATRFAGRPAEEMLGLRGGEALRCIHALDDPRGCGFGEYCQQCVIRNTVLSTLETGETHLQVEAPYYFNNGDNEVREMTLLCSSTPLRMEEQSLALVTLMDITDRKQAEEALRDNQQRIQSIFRSAPVGIGVVVNRVIMEANPKLCEITGYSAGELIGQSARILYASENDFELVGREKYRQIAGFGTGSVETRWKRKDGAIIDVLLSSTPIDTSDLSKGVTFTALDITERKQAEQALHRIEWMLTPGHATADDQVLPSYGDLTTLNTERTILDAVSSQLLESIVNDYLDMLDTSAAVYERNGDYALGIFASSWCRYLDEASRRLCNTDDNHEALHCGKWHCHESCWADASKVAMENGETTDIECAGGLRLHAVPIRSGDSIIGAINFGYGDPPRDQEVLRKLAVKYNVPVDDLVRHAESYESRPPYIIDMAKRRIKSSAQLIGEVVERKRTEKQLVEQNEEYATLNEEYQTINEELNESNSKLKELNTRLEEALEKAEEGDRLKTAFLANMSHEIRTPMNGILGFLGLLGKPDLDDAEKTNYINIVNESGQRLLSTINDIIEISKIESGDIQLDKREINLQPFLFYYHEFFLPLAEDKGLQLKLIQTTANHETIFTDKTKLDSILTNLIKNAIKFTEKGSIEFGCEHQSTDDYLFFVKDTGKGIKPEKLNAVFERFVQEDTSLSSGYEGSGLGLSVTKEYVKALSGKIWVESEPGKGSCFYFTIPATDKEQQTGAASSDSDSHEIILNEVPKKLKLLIAEDDEVSFIYLQEILNTLDCEITRCMKGREAVEQCKSNPGIDVILMDIKMPGMDGYQATREIRKFNKNIYIIAQTAYALAGEEKKALEAGCNAYIAKPVQQDKLMELLSRYIDQATSIVKK